METIKTATQKEFGTDYVVTSPHNRAYIRVLGSDIVTAAKVFSDPAETLQLQNGGSVLEGYTKLISLSLEGDAIKVCLAKE